MTRLTKPAPRLGEPHRSAEAEGASAASSRPWSRSPRSSRADGRATAATTPRSAPISWNARRRSTPTWLREHGKSIEVKRPHTPITAQEHPCLGVAVEQLVVTAIRSCLAASVIRLDAEITSSDIMVHVNEWPGGSIRPAFVQVPPIARHDPSHAHRGADPRFPDLVWAELAVAEAAMSVVGGRLELRTAPGLSASVIMPRAAGLVI